MEKQPVAQTAVAAHGVSLGRQADGAFAPLFLVGAILVLGLLFLIGSGTAVSYQRRFVSFFDIVEIE